MGEDQRRYPRHAVRDIDGEVFAVVPVRVANMSLSGAAIELDRRLSVGERCRMCFFSPQEEAFSIPGEVVWSIPIREPGGSTSSRSAAGIRFDEVFTAPQRRIAEILTKRREDSDRRIGGARFPVAEEEPISLELPLHCSVELLSLSGALIHLDRGFRPPEVLPMEVRIQGEAVRFSGRVASCEGVPGFAPTDYHVGIAFEEMENAGLSRLKDFIGRLES